MLLLHIPISDLVPEISNNPYIITKIRNVGIDYATNTIDAIYEDNAMSIFYFSDYDIRLQNRWVTYEISYGLGGITISMSSTRDFSSRETRIEKLIF